MTNNYAILKQLVYKGAADKNIVITDKVLDRISFEFSVIEKQEFVWKIRRP